MIRERITPIVTVVRIPPFHPSLLVELGEVVRPGQPGGYRVRCQVPAPVARVDGEHPCPIRGPANLVARQEWEQEVATEAALEVIRLLNEVQIKPFMRVETAGIDGMCYELFTGSTHVAWWDTPPADWAPCVAIARKVLALAGVPYEYAELSQVRGGARRD